MTVFVSFFLFSILDSYIEVDGWSIYPLVFYIYIYFPNFGFVRYFPELAICSCQMSHAGET